MKKILVQIAFDPILYGAAGTQNLDFRYPFPHTPHCNDDLNKVVVQDVSMVDLSG